MRAAAIVLLALAAPASVAVAGAGAAPAGRSWSADPDLSHVEFVLHTFWHDVTGTTSALTATLVSTGGDPLVDGTVAVSVETATLVTGIGRRDRKMREEHLEAQRFPRLEFRSTEPPKLETRAPDGARDSSHVIVAGDLTLHGVTRRVAVPVEATSMAGGWLMKGVAVVKLSDYGVPDPSIALNRARDEVEIRFEIRFAIRNGPG